MSSQYWIVSVPVKEGQELLERSKLAEKTVRKGVSQNNYAFKVPQLKVGTLDQLMLVSELLGKADAKYQQMVLKLSRTFAELGKDPKTLIVGEEANRDIHQFCQGFLWNEAKFPLDVPLPKLEEEFSRALVQSEEKFKQLQQSLSQKKQVLTSLDKRAGGSLLMRDLSDFVNQHDVVESNRLTTRLVVVPVKLEQEFLAKYGNIEEIHAAEEKARLEREAEAKNQQEAQRLKEAQAGSKKQQEESQQQQQQAQASSATSSAAASSESKEASDDAEETKSSSAEDGAPAVDQEEPVSERELELRRKLAQRQARLAELERSCSNMVPGSALRLPNCAMCRKSPLPGTPAPGNKAAGGGKGKKSEPTVGLNGEVLAQFRCEACGLILCSQHAEGHRQHRGHEELFDFSQDEDSENVVYRVVVFKKGVEEVDRVLGRYRFSARKISPDQGKARNLQQEKLEAEKEVERSTSAMVRWIMVQYSLVAENWIHVKAVRVFVESVLRYGLPPRFAASILEPKRGKEQLLHAALQKEYGHLDSGNGDGKDGGKDMDMSGLSAAGVQGEFYPYVWMSLDLA